MGQHNGWAIRVSPLPTDRWRARVPVWPPDGKPQAHRGTVYVFDTSATGPPSARRSLQENAKEG